MKGVPGAVGRSAAGYNESRMTADKLPSVLQALGDHTRLRLMNLLSEGEICVCYFVELLRQSQPKISRHLAYLRRAGLVNARREGKWVHYSLAELTPEVEAIVQSVLDAAGRDPELQRDRETLQSACCGVKIPRAIRHAPRPSIS
jgi:ArsR family transcriptional regulator